MRLSPPAVDVDTVAAGENDFYATDSGTGAGGSTAKARLDWETGQGKSYLVPALEVPGFLVGLNLFDRVAFHNKIKEEHRAYTSTPGTFWQHLRRQNWVYDHDTFLVNQIGHPYQGGVMYGLARSSGLNFWESFAYSHLGSFLWEMAGETSHPSYNDLITTGNAGSLLGEALFRVAGLVLEDGGARPDALHEVVAAVISPPTAFNRLVWGERFRSVFPSHAPATFWRVSVGGMFDTHARDRGYTSAEHSSGTLGFHIAYGLPGKGGYTYHRPLDYFDLAAAFGAHKGDVVQEITLRGLLFGADYAAGENLRGIYGVYGNYDYLAPFQFHTSGVGVNLGTTAQYLLGPQLTLQGTVLGGYAFAASGPQRLVGAEREHEYGGTPQGLLSLGLIFGDRALLETTGRIYHLMGIEREARGTETVVFGDAALTVRLTGRHGVGVRYVEAVRNTSYRLIPNRHQAEGTVSVFYTFLGNTTFGAVR